MPSQTPTREEAMALLLEFNSDPSLIKHALAVEAVMRHQARKAGEDEERWGVIGLIHDLDYERFPEQHCQKTREILTERGWPEADIRAVVSHGWGQCSDVEPETLLEKTLFAMDELTGLVAAPRWCGHRGACWTSRQVPSGRNGTRRVSPRGQPRHNRAGRGDARRELPDLISTRLQPCGKSTKRSGFDGAI
jgi:hypothetical protein